MLAYAIPVVIVSDARFCASFGPRKLPSVKTLAHEVVGYTEKMGRSVARFLGRR